LRSDRAGIRIPAVFSADQLAFVEMPSIFTRIVEREIPAQILREDSDFLAFLDVRPIREGHTLVIPKAEVPDIVDLPEPLLAGLLPFARPVAKAIQQVTQATRIGMAVIGLEVPHAHLHLVPIDGLHDLDFRRASPAAGDELAATADRIRAALAN
jgi:histidine triad (HIT) family protein